MAGNEETEQPLNPEQDTTVAAADKSTHIVKKAAKKRAVKKKVVKKQVAAKKAVAKKIAAAPVASNANKAIAQDTAQVTTAVTKANSQEVDSVVTNENSDAGQRGVKKAIPVAAEPHELSREEKVTMSVDAAKTAKSSAGAGFWPKVILWVVVVLASFMYIRSLAHKGQTVTQDERPVPSAISHTTGETGSGSANENSSSTSTVSSNSAGDGPSTVAKVGEVAIEKESESAQPSAVSGPSSEVPTVPEQALVGAERIETPSLQSVVETATTVENDTVPEAPGLMTTQRSDPTTEPVAAANESVSEQSVDSASAPAGEVAADGAAKPVEGEAVAGYSLSSGADSQSSSIDKPSASEVVGEQMAPQTTVVQRAADAAEVAGAVGEKSQRSPEITTPEAAVVSTDATQNTGTTGMDGSAETAGAGSAAVSQMTQRREYATNSRRPTFKELFGYERPKPSLRRRDYGTQLPFSPDGFEQQRVYPAPWQYAPVPPSWGEYPGQYGPYGNYGGYPSYPNMPDWATYQPYGYGPIGY
ncbi:MAG: hypothetical protein KDI47_00640 [Gammaproteobacteria bacterium]|nr:hypothetical protein [Gammaproteobacteria bacterium]